MTRRGHVIQTVFSQKTLQNGLNLPGPPLLKSGVSVSSPESTQVIDPDCQDLRLLKLAPLIMMEPPLSAFRPFGTKILGAGLGSRRLRRRHACARGYLPDPFPRAPKVNAAYGGSHLIGGYLISANILLC